MFLFFPKVIQKSAGGREKKGMNGKIN